MDGLVSRVADCADCPRLQLRWRRHPRRARSKATPLEAKKDRETMSPSDDSARAVALHRDAIIIDGHSDILMAIADRKMRLGERVELPPHEGWQPPLGWADSEESKLYDFSPHTAYFQTMGHYDLPRFLAGGLTAQGMAVYIDGDHLDRPLHRTLEMIYW